MLYSDKKYCRLIADRKGNERTLKARLCVVGYTTGMFFTTPCYSIVSLYVHLCVVDMQNVTRVYSGKV